MKLEDFENKFRAAMNDDFNTPGAMAVLQGLAGRINTARDSGNTSVAAGFAATLKHLAGVVGLLTADPETYLKRGDENSVVDSEWVEERIAARNAARKAKNWQEADRIRDELTTAHIIIEDGSAGTAWRRS